MEFYIKTGSKSSTLFLYYVLNGFKVKAVFKNPQYLDKFSSEQRANTFK